MRMAHRLALRAAGQTSPNPLVGAVVVNHGAVVGKGYHLKKGLPHAEVKALEKAGGHARGGTLYTTLEPCCHFNKRTPPCVPQIIKAKICRVVMAMEDPNPQVSGRGMAMLRRKGIKVEAGLLSEKTRLYNEGYIKYIRTGLPFVTLKVASSLDGKVTSGGGESRWITGEPARKVVHRLRRECDAILVGIGTVLADDPLLTSRLPHRSIGEPLRIVLDSKLRLPLDANIVRKGDPSRTLVVTGPGGSQIKQRRFEDLGVQVLRVPCRRGEIDLRVLMNILGGMEVTTVLVEGGPRVNASLLKLGLIDKILFLLAPLMIGGIQAKGAIGGVSPKKLKDAWALQGLKVSKIGKDLLVEGYVQGN